MFFLIRSAFWLGLVYSAMPFENGEQTRELALMRATLEATAGGAAVLACAEQNILCPALAQAAPAIVVRVKEIASCNSASSLTLDDGKPKWRGKAAWSASNQALAKRREMPI